MSLPPHSEGELLQTEAAFPSVLGCSGKVKVKAPQATGALVVPVSLGALSGDFAFLAKVSQVSL